MDPSVDLDALLSRARTKARAGKLDDAAATFKKILQVLPGHAEAHVFLGKDFLRRGDRVRALRHTELALRAQPGEIERHRELATVHLAVLKANDAEPTLATICKELPFAFTSLLHLSRLQEGRGDTRNSLLGYTRAIKTAQLHGFWLDEDSTPPWLLNGVEHALRTADRGRVALYQEWLAGTQKRHGKGEMKRVAECLEMYLGLKPTVLADPRQKPSFLYFPGLPITPVFERDTLPFAEWYEAETEAIRDEAIRVLEEERGIQPFHYDVPEERRDLLTRGDWDAYFFFDEGTADAAHHAACPHTSSVLARLPLDHVRDHGPEVCFSIMRPGAQILPHRGVTNTRSVLHLGLEIPPGCALNLVGVREVHWQRGRCFAFDDTYEHEAWNRSEHTRVVLLGDIWNPHLTMPERAAIADLVGMIGDFNRAVTPTAPA